MKGDYYLSEFKLTKLSGIYQINNIINGKLYIGHSINLNFKWYHHLDSLFKGIHPNSKLQEDFNTYSVSAFSFRILELIDGKENLINKEQEYLNNLNFDSNYNIYNSNKQLIEHDIDAFFEYIKMKIKMKY